MKFATFCLNHSLQDRPKGGAGIDGGGLLQDGPVLLHDGPQGDHIWVNVVSDNGLEIAPNNKAQGVKVYGHQLFPLKKGPNWQKTAFLPFFFLLHKGSAQILPPSLKHASSGLIKS